MQHSSLDGPGEPLLSVIETSLELSNPFYWKPENTALCKIVQAIAKGLQPCLQQDAKPLRPLTEGLAKGHPIRGWQPGGFARREGAPVSDQIGDSDVDLMTHCGDYRRLRAEYGRGDNLLVECREILVAASPRPRR